MLVVISHALMLDGEAGYINALFDAGMEVFHMRKPSIDRASITELIHSIDPVYWPRIALHQHHEMASDFGIYRLHLTEERRRQGYEPEGYLSTSIHGACELSDRFQYAFFGPVFDSISKPGYKAASFIVSGPRLIAIGGITPDNAREALQMGFAGVAVLGSLWQKPADCVKQFKALRRYV